MGQLVGVKQDERVEQELRAEWAGWALGPVHAREAKWAGRRARGGK